MNIYLTGVSGHIGKYLLKHLLDKKNKVVGFDIKDFDDDSLLNNKNFNFIRCDLSNYEEIIDSYEIAQRDFGIPDVLINNAGIIYSAPIVSFSIDGEISSHDFKKWNEVINSSLSSTFYLTTLAAKSWVQKTQNGLIINFSSIASYGNPGQSAYSAAKSGINGLTISTAKELGQYGIRCVALAPGFINTKSTELALSEDRLRKIKRAIPLKRLGDVSEIALAIDFAMENEYLTGVVLDINGGMSI